jgi:hypothetical protein
VGGGGPPTPPPPPPRLRALLHDASLALDGHRLVQLRHLATETEREPKDGRRARLGFRAVVEPIIP